MVGHCDLRLEARGHILEGDGQLVLEVAASAGALLLKAEAADH